MSLLRRIHQGVQHLSPAVIARWHRRTRRKTALKRKKNRGHAMQYERLVQWTTQTWQERTPDAPYLTIWAAADCSNQIALRQIKSGRRLRGKVIYEGYDELASPVITPISDYGVRGKQTVLSATAGAYVFKFRDGQGQPFEVIYASSYFDDDVQDLTAVALVPPNRLSVWAAFESLCARALRSRIRRRRDVYVIGGTDAFFDPTVEWEDVILEPTLKDAIFEDIEAFFGDGVEIYRKLKLVPFRKLLLAGVPGTGKTMLCAALAKHALRQRRIVVYVSGSDRDGATFEKMQRAFQAVASASFPTLLIVEEIDAYLRGDDKARILNVLDGFESPNNSKGTLMLATTNYPDAIDDRVFKRPGRLDRIFVVSAIEDEDVAARMLRHYMADQWDESHAVIVPDLLHQPGAFVREVALQARMFAARERKTQVTAEMLRHSVAGLVRQMKYEDDFLKPRRAIALDEKPRRRSGFGQED